MDERHRGRARALASLGCTQVHALATRDEPLPREEDPQAECEGLGSELGIAREVPTHPFGERHHPLTNRDTRDHPIEEQNRLRVRVPRASCAVRA
jgi:hypothetical protein